jgi:hypothetical protein
MHAHAPQTLPGEPVCLPPAELTPAMDAAWSVLDAANDVGDIPIVDACRRVIDAHLRGAFPQRSDMQIVSEYFR